MWTVVRVTMRWRGKVKASYCSWARAQGRWLFVARWVGDAQTQTRDDCIQGPNRTGGMGSPQPSPQMENVGMCTRLLLE